MSVNILLESSSQVKHAPKENSGHWEYSANEMVRWWVKDGDQAVYPLTSVGGDDPPGHYSPIPKGGNDGR